MHTHCFQTNDPEDDGQCFVVIELFNKLECDDGIIHTGSFRLALISFRSHTHALWLIGIDGSIDRSGRKAGRIPLQGPSSRHG